MVGIALILAAVFVPTVFIPGITGRLYQQFAVTIAISVIISAFNALTAQPGAFGAAAAPEKSQSRGPLGASSAGSTACSDARTNGYVNICGALIRKSVHRALCCWSGASPSPAGIGDEAAHRRSCRKRIRAMCCVNLQLPNAASLQRTDDAVRAKWNRSSRARPGWKLLHAWWASTCSAGVQDTYSAFFFVT